MIQSSLTFDRGSAFFRSAPIPRPKLSGWPGDSAMIHPLGADVNHKHVLSSVLHTDSLAIVGVADLKYIFIWIKKRFHKNSI